jgi:oleandomycin transport system permease protein
MTAIPAPTRRITPLGGLRNTFTLTWRSVLKIRTNMEDLLGLSLQPIMYLLLFTYVFGGAIAGGVHKYLQFSLPGILVLSVVFATLGTGLMLNQDIATGVSTGSAACRSRAGRRWPAPSSATWCATPSRWP